MRERARKLYVNHHRLEEIEIELVREEGEDLDQGALYAPGALENHGHRTGQRERKRERLSERGRRR